MKQKWQQVRLTLLGLLALSAAAAAGFSYVNWGTMAAGSTVATALCLALGIWLTELLVSVFMGVRKANPTAIALLFLGKLVWWGSILVLSRNHAAGMEKPIALGIAAFLFAVTLTGIFHYGMPKISDPQEPRS